MAPGEVLFEKGEPGRLMYVVKTGDLQILDGNYVYETVSAGGIVGEMAMVDGSSRSATVCAIKRSTVIPIDERRFLFMVQQTPFFALRVMRVMTARPTPQVKGLAGGLAVALREAFQAYEGPWFGWSGKVAAHPRPAPSRLMVITQEP